MQPKPFPKKSYRLKMILCWLACAGIIACEPAETPQPVAAVPTQFSLNFDYSSEEMFEFNIEEFLREHASHLLPYAEIISHVAGEKRISPRLLIALMEQQSEAIANPQFVAAKPLGNLSETNGFLEQIRDVSNRLREMASSTDLSIQLDAPPPAILAVLPREDLHQLADIYQRLFPGVTNQPKTARLIVAQPPSHIMLQFPFFIGQSWLFSGTHAHDGEGSTRSSIDFMEELSEWGAANEAIVVASAAGKVKKHSSCFVSIVHSNGWSTGYYHLDQITVETGDKVQANEPLAKYATDSKQALCMGGTSDMPHLHWTLMQDNKEADLTNQAISGWLIHSGTRNYDRDCASMYLHRNGEKVCPWTPILNQGAQGNFSCDQICSTSCPCGEGEGDCDNDSECQEGLFCQLQEGTDYCRAPSEECQLRIPFSSTYCSESCPCGENEGDCDNDSECKEGLFCQLQTGTDYCVPTSEMCHEGGPSSSSYCSADCPCGEGEGDCDNDSECKDGLLCRLQPGTDFCTVADEACHKGGMFSSDYCSASCPCGEGEGDCDNDAQCKEGLFCQLKAGTDTCVPRDNENNETHECHLGESSSSTYCSASCPCDAGEGHCDNDAECKAGLVCVRQGEIDVCQTPPRDEPSPTLAMSQSIYAEKERIVVAYDNLPGGPTDWIGIFPAEESNDKPLEKINLQGATRGSAKFRGQRKGSYVARLFINAADEAAYEVAFTVE